MICLLCNSLGELVTDLNDEVQYFQCGFFVDGLDRAPETCNMHVATIHASKSCISRTMHALQRQVATE